MSVQVIEVEEDLDCAKCGYPLGTGDRAVVRVEDPDGPVFCSRYCAELPADRNRS